MEGLNLEDLNFDDTDTGQVFDAFAAPATDSKPMIIKVRLTKPMSIREAILPLLNRMTVKNFILL